MEQAATNNSIDQNDTKVVLTIKYKIYTAVLVILMAFWRWYVSDSAAEYDTTRQSVVTLQQQKILKEAEYQKVVSDLTKVNQINQQKTDLFTCLSTKGCATIPDALKNSLPQVRAFLQLQKNEWTKMEFDQKKVLANINEYLLKWTNGVINGAITSIVFGNVAPVAALGNVVQIPITLTIDFADKNGLLSFVYNVENTISAQFPMLYKVNSINYDIVKYQQNQTVTIELIGYMLK